MTIANQLSDARPYIGRFAPSPTGPLHLGSLVCALASYLHAKRHNGQWLVRIEDVDSPRSNPKMHSVILTSLYQHGLHWDGDVIYQSQRQAVFQQYLNTLKCANRLYACQCTRQQRKARSRYYDGFCRELSLPYKNNAIRFKQLSKDYSFVDLHLGDQHINLQSVKEDPVLLRADGIFSYHLAVVADDIEQGVTHIVRGMDLLETTPIHLALYEAFKEVAPQYLHIPLVSQRVNEKLSKQHYSPAIDNTKALDNLRLALACLGMPFSSQAKFCSIQDCLSWAIEHWTSNLLPKQSEILVSVANGVYSLPVSTFNEY